MRPDRDRRWDEEHALRQSSRRNVTVLRAPVAHIRIGEYEYRGQASGIAVRVKPGGRAVRSFLYWCYNHGIYAEPTASVELIDDAQEPDETEVSDDFVLWVPRGQESRLAEASRHDYVLTAYHLTNVRPPRASGAGEFRHGVPRPHPLHGYTGPSRAERLAETERDRREALPKAERETLDGQETRRAQLARLAHLALRVGPPSLADVAEIDRLMAECGIV